MWCRPLEWNLNGTTDPRDGSVDHLLLNSLKDRHGPIRAPKSPAAALSRWNGSFECSGNPYPYEEDCRMTAPLTFAFSDDVPSAQLERAAAFAGEVRHIQSTSRKKFSGGNHLPPESQHAIADAVNAAVTRKGGKVRVVRCLLERFEELCRRRKCDIDPELRVALARVLAGELAVNRAALGESALKLIGVTVLQGAIGPDLVREFERFRDMPWVFTTAALSHPADPRAFLRKVADTADALAAEPEFEHFRDVTP